MMGWTPTAPIYVDIVEATALQYPQAFADCHRPELGVDRATRFVRYAALALHGQDPKFGLNGKRGTDEISMDAVSYRHPDGPGGVEIIDIVGGAGGPDPRVQWSDVTQATIDSGTVGKWIDPMDDEPIPLPDPVPAPADAGVLDHPLDDYRFWLRHGAHREAAIIDWHGRTHVTVASVADIAHVVWRCTFEHGRWSRELGAPLTLRKVLQATWPLKGPFAGATG